MEVIMEYWPDIVKGVSHVGIQAKIGPGAVHPEYKGLEAEAFLGWSGHIEETTAARVRRKQWQMRSEKCHKKKTPSPLK